LLLICLTLSYSKLAHFQFLWFIVLAKKKNEQIHILNILIQNIEFRQKAITWENCRKWYIRYVSWDLFHRCKHL